MMERILVAVDDSGPALAAADLAIRVAKSWNAEVLFVAVAEDGLDLEPVLQHVLGLASAAAVAATATTRRGTPPIEEILAAADEWRADLLVMGQSDKRHPGGPYVGSQTEHVLEFSSLPVLVAPDQPPTQL
jgi:nucleotide-binding universal stress UspA family protein